jgi:hypothetical protein
VATEQLPTHNHLHKLGCRQSKRESRVERNEKKKEEEKKIGERREKTE